MNRLFYLMGKSASGKDSIYRQLLHDLPLRSVVPTTTRPRRSYEEEGREYHFVDCDELARMRTDERIIEERTYHTILGDWVYLTAKDSIDLAAGSYLAIGTPESLIKMQEHFGTEAVVPLYIEVEDGIRLQRALDREKQQAEPKYAEMCRRFLADEEDFSEEKLAAAGIGKRFANNSFADCVAEIEAYIGQL